MNARHGARLRPSPLALGAVAALASCAALTGGEVSSARPAYADGPPKPVLVELFTSEGCSSCPPAERALGSIARAQSVAGADVVLLAFHVDYWDYLGWRDPFSSSQFTARQSSYASAMGRSDNYTPQAIVDGRYQFIGSDAGAARSALSQAAHGPKLALHVTAVRANGPGAAVDVDVGAIAGARAPHLFVALAEDGLRTDVRGGENAGQRLEHPWVVRALRDVGPIAASGTKAHVVVPTAPTWNRDRLRAVAFIQEEGGGPVYGVAYIPVGPG